MQLNTYYEFVLTHLVAPISILTQWFSSTVCFVYCNGTFLTPSQGLVCLERDLQILNKKRPSSSFVEEQQTCDSSKAIPLKYEPIHKGGNFRDESLWQLSTQTSFRGSWHQLSKALLLRKACMANYVLAAEFLANQQYGCSLKHVRYAIHCFGMNITACPKPNCLIKYKKFINQLNFCRIY